MRVTFPPSDIAVERVNEKFTFYITNDDGIVYKIPLAHGAAESVYDDLGHTTDTWEQVEAAEGPNCASNAWRRAAGIAPSFN
jgi:hypothetical protein